MVNRIIVGAPRANSTLPEQVRINEPGVIYKCTIQNGQCNPFNFDNSGNKPIDDNDYTIKSQYKDSQ